MIVINVFRALAKGELSQETLEAVIQRADSEKLPTALERVAQAADRRGKPINGGLPSNDCVES
jgi:hypothetical protein